MFLKMTPVSTVNYSSKLDINLEFHRIKLSNLTCFYDIECGHPPLHTPNSQQWKTKNEYMKGEEERDVKERVYLNAMPSTL
jgi:hypothetical protein